MQFVDAIGGVTIDVPRRIPVGGRRNSAGVQVGVTSFLEKGRRLLNGYQALWFARSRSDSDDFERMGRQRCVIGAIAQQADPATLARNLPAIMAAAKNNIRTDISLQAIPAWVTLTERVKSSRIRSLPFTNAVIAPGDPDFDKIHALVQEALVAPPTVTAGPSPSLSASTGASPAPRAGTRKPTPTTKAVDPNKAVDVNEVC